MQGQTRESRGGDQSRAESHSSALGSQAGGRAWGDLGTCSGGLALSLGAVVQPQPGSQEWQGCEQRVTLCPRLGTGSSWGGPEDSESRGCCSTKDDGFQVLSQEGHLSHGAEVCQGVSDVTALPVGMGTGRWHWGNSPGCGKGCEGQELGWEVTGCDTDTGDPRSLRALEMVRVGSPGQGKGAGDSGDKGEGGQGVRSVSSGCGCGLWFRGEEEAELRRELQPEHTL